MSEHSFETIIRDAATVVTRRSSLMTLGTVALGTLASTFSADAKKKNKNNNRCKKEKKQCRADLEACTTQAEACTAQQAAQCPAQAEDCTVFLTGLCGNDPDCDHLLDCCPFLGSCDAAGFINCLNTPSPM